MNGSEASPPLDAPKNSGGLQKEFFLLVALAIAAHTALIFLFGAKKPIAPRPPINVPQLQFANRADDLLELDNPTLFALPNAHDFSSGIWQTNADVAQPSFRYREAPRWLPLSPENQGATLAHFLQTNQFGGLVLDFKPAPQIATLNPDFTTDLPKNSSLQILGALAQRKLISSPALPSLPLNDILPPSKVQILVNESGTVVSAVLLPPENSLEAAGRVDTGDAKAIAYALQLKFLPAVQPAFGLAVFHWHTIPLNSTNAP